MGRTLLTLKKQSKNLSLENQQIADNTVELIKLADSLASRLILKDPVTGHIMEELNLHGSNKIVGLADGMADQDAVNIRQLRAAASNVKYLKAPVKAVSVLEVNTLTAIPQAVMDNAELAVNDRILIDKYYANKTLNGIYVITTVNGTAGQHTYAVTRASDAAISSDFVWGMMVNVVGGETMEGSMFELVGYDTDMDGLMDLGEDEMIFIRTSGLGMVDVGYGLTKLPTSINDTIELLLTPEGGLIADTLGLRVNANEFILNKYVGSDIPTGVINGTNKTFTLTYTPIERSEHIFYNGQLMTRNEDYVIDWQSNTFTVVIAPESGDRLTASYFKQ